jgi:hypothetical protein
MSRRSIILAVSEDLRFFTQNHSVHGCSGILMSLYVYRTVIYRNIYGKLLCEDQMSRNYSSTIVAVPSCLKYFWYLFFDGWLTYRYGGNFQG